MWLFTGKNQYELVTVAVTQDYLACAWLQKVHKKDQTLTLRAYYIENRAYMQCADGMLYNATALATSIESFLKKHNLQKAFIAVAVSGPGVHSKFIVAPDAHYDLDSVGLDKGLYSICVSYVYPLENQFVFYVHAINRVLLLQYMLMAIRGHFNVVKITTTTMALLQAYKYLKGAHFRQAELAADLSACNNNIEHYFSLPLLKQTIVTTITLGQQDLVPLFISIGLFISFKEHQ